MADCKYYTRPGDTSTVYQKPEDGTPETVYGYVRPGWSCGFVVPPNTELPNPIGLGWMSGRGIRHNARVKRFRRYRID